MWDAGIKSWEANDHRAAIDSFSQIQQPSARILFNIGSAYLTEKDYINSLRVSVPNISIPLENSINNVYVVMLPLSLCDHELSIVCHHCLWTVLLATGLITETSYLAHTCTCTPSVST